MKEGREVLHKFMLNMSSIRAVSWRMLSIYFTAAKGFMQDSL